MKGSGVEHGSPREGVFAADARQSISVAEIELEKFGCQRGQTGTGAAVFHHEAEGDLRIVVRSETDESGVGGGVVVNLRGTGFG